MKFCHRPAHLGLMWRLLHQPEKQDLGIVFRWDIVLQGLSCAVKEIAKFNARLSAFKCITVDS